MAINLTELLKKTSELVSASNLMETTKEIWSSDRQFTYPAFQRTAKKITGLLRSWDVKARIFEVPADGRTVFGDWKMPLGWDCRSARLEIYDPFEERGTVLADASVRPTGVVMWSGPTPPEGITAGVVRIESKEDLQNKRRQIVGRIVYMPVNPRPFKRELLDAGALGVVTSFSPIAAKRPGVTAWINGWSDDPQGWAFHAEDTPLPAMVISPEVGVKLDVLLDRGPVKLRMKIDAEYREDIMPLVSGMLEGSLAEEVLAIGHIMEQGANDNASGAAVILESLRVLQKGTADGVLPARRRVVRGLLVNECYGTIGFALMNPGIMRRITAAINWDTLGRHREADGVVFRRHYCPDISASVVDTLLDLLLREWLPQAAPYAIIQKERPFMLTDNVFNDPVFGIPCPYVDSQDDVWHTSGDDMEGISPQTLHAFATISAAYLQYLASAGTAEALWLARHTVQRYGQIMEKVACEHELILTETLKPEGLPYHLFSACEHLDYVLETGERAVLSAKRFVEREERSQANAALQKMLRHLRRLNELEKKRLRDIAACEPKEPAVSSVFGEWGQLRPLRRFIGTPTYANIHYAQVMERELSSPTWNARVIVALFQADGTRTLAEIARRIKYEYGRPCDPELLRQFVFMAEHGLLQWLKPGEEIPKERKVLSGVAAESAKKREERLEEANEQTE